MLTATCAGCTEEHIEIQRQLYLAERARWKGTDPTPFLDEIARRKQRIADCPRAEHSRQVKPLPKGQPAKAPAPKKVKQPKPLPSAADIAAALAETEAAHAANRRAKELATRVVQGSHRGTRLAATGQCHTCQRPVTGERRYCGPCAAAR